MAPALPTDDDEMLAAELAFGMLDAPERAIAEARLASDPAFADRHRLWQARVDVICGSRSEQPRPSVWTAIAQRLPTNDDRTDRPWSRLGFWRATTGLAAAAAVVLAVVASDRHATPNAVPTAAAAGPPLVAILDGEGRSTVSVSFNRASGRLIVVPSRLKIGDQSAQLWVIPVGGTPHSLGVIETSAPGNPLAPASAGRLIAPGATLAISVEPSGGSPTGLPTGPVILKGKATMI